MARASAPGGDGAVPSGLAQPLERAVDTALAKRLHRAFGMRTLGDLLLRAPRRYAKRGELTPLDELVVGEQVSIVAEVEHVTGRDTAQRTKSGRPGRLTTVTLSDGTGRLELTFFNQMWREHELQRGATGVFSGTISAYRDRRQLAHPEYSLFERGEIDPERWANEPVPIYRATASIPTTDVSKIIRAQLDVLGEIADPVPEDVQAGHGLLPLRTAIEQAHRPETIADGYRALHTLAWHEAFLLETYLLATRAWLQTLPSTPREPGALLAELDAHLPFELTGDQREVGEQILADLASRTSMHRLVQGEVGSGKTVVALRAMVAVADSGGQAALLAPTEVLAAQHLRSMTRTLGPELAARLRPILITGSMPAAERKRALLAAAAGQSHIVIGTHALLNEKVQFADLGLVVIDEQHRFGVEQREALRQKGLSPHTLVLTATPIPRTIAMTAFGDLDVSAIRTLPPGRTPIESHVVPRDDLRLYKRSFDRLAEELAAGRQAFVVCPAIDPQHVEEGVEAAADEGQGARPIADVQTITERMRAHASLGRFRIAPLTGAMPSDEKDATMRAFAAGEIDLLVATTVIEVGVDVPNASTMVVLDAERFGVSQLHQLRGRVGRGDVAGLCLLVTNALPETPARERVEAVAATLDGFALAEIDLEHRGEGDVLGARQSGGRSGLKLLRVTRDGEIIAEARDAAAAILAADPELKQHEALRVAVHHRLDADARAAIGAA